MAKTSNPDTTVARRDTNFPSKNAGLLDTSQIEVGIGAGFELSLALAVAFRAIISKRQNSKAEQGVLRLGIAEDGGFNCRRFTSLLRRARHRWQNILITLKMPARGDSECYGLLATVRKNQHFSERTRSRQAAGLRLCRAAMNARLQK